jgi:hypothetical protein
MSHLKIINDRKVPNTVHNNASKKKKIKHSGLHEIAFIMDNVLMKYNLSNLKILKGQRTKTNTKNVFMLDRVIYTYFFFVCFVTDFGL